MLKGIKNTLAVIGGITVASVIYKTAKRIKESGVTMKDLKQQGEKISEDIENYVEKKKKEKMEKEAVKEEVKEAEAVLEEGNTEEAKEENKEG